MADADYTDAYSTSTVRAAVHSPEQWARHVLEGASLPMRAFLRFGWRYVLGFPRTDAPAVLGWPLVAGTADWVVLQQESWLFAVALLMLTTDDEVVWATRVKHRSRLARPVWFVVGAIHRRFAPRALHRAAHSGGIAGVVR